MHNARDISGADEGNERAMERADWLHRFRRRLRQRRPGLTERDLYDVANIETYDDLCTKYQDDPEGAADEETGQWKEEDWAH